MKRLFFLFLLGTSTLYSQTYYLNVWSQGKVTSIPVQDIQKLTFSNVSSAIGNKEVTTMIKSFQLLQNFPNPFNPGTTIEYQIPAAGDVEIQIFDINGHLVKTFKHNHAASGAYTVSWDSKNEAGQSVASGLYIYRVAYANAVITKKMMLVK